MKRIALLRMSQILAAAVCGLMLLTACTGLRWTPRGYEYRYRLFEASQPLPDTMLPPYSNDALSHRFLPVGAINRSMDALGAEGFVLVKVERLSGSAYYRFTFRRPQAPGTRPSLAPAEFTGVYQVQPPGDMKTYLAFAPAYSGYTVYVFNGDEVPEVIDSEWDGEQLQAQTGETHHNFMISGDGLAIVHVRERIGEKGLERQVLNARRLQTGRP